MDDQELIKRILAGDQHAFRQLVRNHQELVVSVCWRVLGNKEEAEDVAQEVMIKVFQRLGQFKFQSKLSTWIVSIAYRLAINQYHKLSRHQKTGLESAISLTKESARVEDFDLRQHIEKAIQQLPEKQRTIITLYHLGQFSYTEIEDITGLPQGTVKNYLFRARAKLKKLLAYLKEDS